MLRRSLAAGNIRGLGEAGAAIEIFRNSLGLLVERAPGVYGFLHQTFVEFLAAHELLRTGSCSALLKSKRKAYASRWREVILLGVGILGVLQANDEALGAAVKALVVSSHKQRSKGPLEVVSLLGAVLADDPALSVAHAEMLLDEVLSTWSKEGFSSTWDPWLQLEELAGRISSGHWSALVPRRAFLVRAQLAALLKDEELGGWSQPAGLFERLGVEMGDFCCERLLTIAAGIEPNRAVWRKGVPRRRPSPPRRQDRICYPMPAQQRHADLVATYL